MSETRTFFTRCVSVYIFYVARNGIMNNIDLHKISIRECAEVNISLLHL